jgi:hypothetical protein
MPSWIALLVLAVLGPWYTPAVSAPVEQDDLPIFDTHIHYNRDAWSVYSVDEALGLLDQAGVRKAFVSSTPDDGTLLLYERAAERIVPVLRPYRTPGDQASWMRDPGVLTYVEERLNTNTPYIGIGEFHLLSAQSSGQVPLAFAALSASRGLVLHAHADAKALDELLSLRPDMRVLWAHAGMTQSPSTLQRVLDAHPNVWVELALRTDVAPGGRLDADWAALFARYPDRFMIGTDTWITSQWTGLPALMANVRIWLRQLPPDLAQAIAFGNAERLLTNASSASGIGYGQPDTRRRTMLSPRGA